MIAVEFNGISGCGKSFFVHEFVGVSNQKKIVVMSDFLASLKKKSLLSKSLFRIHYCDTSILLKAYLLLFRLKPYRKTRIKYIRSFVNVCATYRYFARHDDVILLADEGLIQRFCSILYPDGFESASEIVSRFFDTILPRYPFVLFVSLRADVDVVMKRLELRNTKQSRIELEPEEARFESLKKTQNIIDGIRELIENDDNSLCFDVSHKDFENFYVVLDDKIESIRGNNEKEA